MLWQAVRRGVPSVRGLDSGVYFNDIGTVESSDALLSLGALAQTSRLEIFRLLIKRGPEGYTPRDLIQKLDIPAPTLSFHLKELQRAHLVEARREGRCLHYRADFGRMNGLIGFLTEHCCSLGSADCGTSCTPAAALAAR